jgi:hypothetical protein
MSHYEELGTWDLTATVLAGLTALGIWCQRELRDKPGLRPIEGGRGPYKELGVMLPVDWLNDLTMLKGNAESFMERRIKTWPGST